MKALTVQQLWAWAIIHGPKQVENRTWSTSHRGPLAIHAGRKTDPGSLAILAAVGCSPPGHVPRGAVIGVVDLVEVVPYEPGQQRLTGVDDPYSLADDPLADGPLCWIFRNPRPCEPVFLPGKPGLFNVDLPQWLAADTGL